MYIHIKINKIKLKVSLLISGQRHGKHSLPVLSSWWLCPSVRPSPILAALSFIMF